MQRNCELPEGEDGRFVSAESSRDFGHCKATRTDKAIQRIFIGVVVAAGIASVILLLRVASLAESIALAIGTITLVLAEFFSQRRGLSIRLWQHVGRPASNEAKMPPARPQVLS